MGRQLCLSNRAVLFLVAALIPNTSSARSLGYLFHAAAGQLAIMNHTRPIADVIRDERTSPRVREILKKIPGIKSFGEQHGLKKTKNYEDYVKLDRPVANWVVSACAPLEFKSKKWGFPIVGSFTYLGFFDLDRAKGLVAELQTEGLDVDLRGARAYSTLGWFNDPILSSMIGGKGNATYYDLVNVVLHESVHASIYLNDQAYFNESIASFAADKMTEQYLAQVHGKKSTEVVEYLRMKKSRAKRVQKMHQAYLKLEKLYSGNQTKKQKLAQKTALLGRLKKELNWKRELNNATVIRYKTYDSGMKEFEAVYQACGQNWGRFWKAMNQVTEDSFKKEHQNQMAGVLTADLCSKN